MINISVNDIKVLKIAWQYGPQVLTYCQGFGHLLFSKLRLDDLFSEATAVTAACRLNKTLPWLWLPFLYLIKVSHWIQVYAEKWPRASTPSHRSCMAYWTEIPTTVRYWPDPKSFQNQSFEPTIWGYWPDINGWQMFMKCRSESCLNID